MIHFLLGFDYWPWQGSLAIGLIGVSLAIFFAVKRKEHIYGWLPILYFSLMEFLQTASNFALHELPGMGFPEEMILSINMWLTRASFTHIAFQPVFVAYFSMYFVMQAGQGHRLETRTWFTTKFLTVRTWFLTLSWIGSLIFFFRMIIPMFFDVPIEHLCPPNLALCGNVTETYVGKWHLAWQLELLALDKFYLAYYIPVFLAPFFIGAHRWAMLHLAVGPVLAMILAKDPNEMPAVWCLFSIGILTLTHVGPIHNWLTHKKRVHE